MIDKLKKTIAKAIKAQGIENPIVNIEHPEDNTFGDFSSNVSLIYSKQLKVNSKELAEKIIVELKKDFENEVKSIEIAGPCFINIKMKEDYFYKAIIDINNLGADVGKISIDANKKIMVEFTDPNPFKIFHIGHLMANTIGESLSRVVEFSNAKVIRACYQGDVGLHVAKTMWAILKNKANFSNENLPLNDRIKFLGDMYVIGTEKYEIDIEAKKEITDINKKIFEKSDAEINIYYKKGRDWSLEYFDTIYKKLGTKFDEFYFESEVSESGAKIVKELLKKGVFENSEGAIIFPGEKYGEHTRVFINSQNLPTYEAKEIGLTMRKFEQFPDLAESIVVTANEQNAYFKVVIAALNIIDSNIAKKVKHLSHGLLRPASGKMSSRKGNVVSADIFLEEFESLVDEKLKDRNFTKDEHEEIRQMIAIAALKYTVLRQAIGGDIIYDPQKAISFEGDSGPYLQYSTVRANAVLIKAKEAGITEAFVNEGQDVGLFEKLLIRFPEVVERSRLDYAPHHIVTYLTNLSSEFNSYYANNKIINADDPLSPYRVLLTKVFVQIMKNGLWILGIKVPNRM